MISSPFHSQGNMLLINIYKLLSVHHEPSGAEQCDFKALESLERCYDWKSFSPITL
jgi:hypothetical protein